MEWSTGINNVWHSSQGGDITNPNSPYRKYLYSFFFSETICSSRRMLSFLVEKPDILFNYKLQVEKKTKKGEKCSYIQTETILNITSLATASFVLDVNRSFDDVTHVLPRMHMPILLIREK